MTVVPFTAGLHQLAEHVWAWLQPDGGWGLSNAGLVRGGDQSLLIDTQFDLPRTRAGRGRVGGATPGIGCRFVIPGDRSDPLFSPWHRRENAANARECGRSNHPIP